MSDTPTNPHNGPGAPEGVPLPPPAPPGPALPPNVPGGPALVPPLATPGAPSVSVPPRRHRPTAGGPRIVGALAGAIVALSAWLPWVTVQTFFGSLSVTGFKNGEGDGVLTLGLGVLGALCAWKGGKTLIVTIVTGVLAAAIGIYDWSDITALADDADGFVLAEAGIGLYLTIAGAIVMVVSGVAGLVSRD